MLKGYNTFAWSRGSEYTKHTRNARRSHKRCEAMALQDSKKACRLLKRERVLLFRNVAFIEFVVFAGQNRIQNDAGERADGQARE